MQPDPIEILDDFLSSDDAADDCMMIDELDGYLTAIILAPTSIETNEWMPLIWGTTGQPHTGYQEEADEVQSIIQQMCDDTATSLEKGITFEPLFHQEMDGNGNTRAEPQHWCIGFMKGLALSEAEWKDGDDTIEQHLQPIIFFSQGTKEVDPMDHIQNLLDGNSRADKYAIEDISQSIEAIYQLNRK